MCQQCHSFWMILIIYLRTKAAVLKLWPWGPQVPSEDLWVKNCFKIILNYYMSFSFSFFHECSVEVSRGNRLHDMWHSKRLNEEADIRIQLSSMKSDIKQTCRNTKQYYSSHYFFCFSKCSSFHQKYIIYFCMQRVYYCYFK